MIPSCSTTVSASDPECESPNPKSTLTQRLNHLLKHSGPGYTLSLCPGEEYILTAPLKFAAPYQEISTAGLPTDSTRAMLVVSGKNQTTAVRGTCSNCEGVKLRNVQIDGARRNAPIIHGGANIAMGGSNAHQRIEYVRSFDPRGWSCLHVAQGHLDCTNATVQNNDIGPAGSDAFQEWADGISVACRNSLVRKNKINNPTDGGVVLFGSPGTRVEENIIWTETKILLGGINLVDISPFGGNFSGVVVANNIIAGGFASEAPQGSKTRGTNKHNAIIKAGIAIGPRVWFGERHLSNVSYGGVVSNNQLTGAFGYGVAMSSVVGFTVENNVLIGNTSFIGVRGKNCTAKTIPTPTPFLLDSSNVIQSITQPEFKSIKDAPNLVTCVLPPTGGEHWPFGNTNDLVSSVLPDPEISLSCPEALEDIATPRHRGLDTSIAVLVLFVVAVVASFIAQIWASKRRAVTVKSHRKHGSCCKCAVVDQEPVRVCSA